MKNTYIIYYMLLKKKKKHSKNWRTVLSKTHPNHVIQHTHHPQSASDQQRVAHHNLQNTQNLQQLLSNLTHPCWNAPGFNMSPSIAAEMTLKWDKKQISTSPSLPSPPLAIQLYIYIIMYIYNIYIYISNTSYKYAMSASYCISVRK